MLKTHNGDTVGSRIEPLSVTIPGACELTGLGRSKLYGLLGSGEIASVKVGKRRLVTVASLRAWLDRLAEQQLLMSSAAEIARGLGLGRAGRGLCRCCSGPQL